MNLKLPPVTLLFLATAAGALAAASRPPNVVLILADDLGYFSALHFGRPESA